jgi:hypothetical protein
MSHEGLNDHDAAFFEGKNACDSPFEWLAQYDSIVDAWDECERSDWMLWIIREGYMDWRDNDLLRRAAVQAVRSAEELLFHDALVECLNAADMYANHDAPSSIMDDALDQAMLVECETPRQELAKIAVMALCDPDGTQAALDAFAAIASAHPTPKATALCYEAQADVLRQVCQNPYRSL